MNLCGIEVSDLGSFIQLPYFYQTNFHVLVIHDLMENLVSGGILLENRDPEQPTSILWDSIDYLR